MVRYKTKRSTMLGPSLAKFKPHTGCSNPNAQVKGKDWRAKVVNAGDVVPRKLAVNAERIAFPTGSCTGIRSVGDENTVFKCQGDN